MRITSVAVTITTVALALSLAACSSGDSMSAPMDDTADQTVQTGPTGPTGQMMLTELAGSFDGLNGKHTTGDVAINGDTVTLTGFSSDEGPDLHLYLTVGTDEAAVAAGVEIGAVAFDQEEQTFALVDVDAAGFTDLVVHCDKAKAVFGAARLS